ncbi:MAG: hypothetical protein ABI795_07325 [Chthoniobacterales bacterium]
METSVKPRRAWTFSLSAEAIIGIGTTIGALGILALLLGCAEGLRGVTAVAAIWLPVGAVMFIAGGLTAAAAWTGKIGRRRPASDPAV